MASSIVAGTRGRMQMKFYKDEVLFDPQQVLFSAIFTPSTAGVVQTEYDYTYNVDAEIVRSGVGIYYVEQLFDSAGRMKYTWRSTAWGEELNMEEIFDIAARTVVT